MSEGDVEGGGEEEEAEEGGDTVLLLLLLPPQPPVSRLPLAWQAGGARGPRT